MEKHTDILNADCLYLLCSYTVHTATYISMDSFEHRPFPVV